ncbi:MAG: hypothetical protein ACR2O3_05350 [Rhizobiaceae bacterium]
MSDTTTITALWWVVIVSGLYHGLNPGMGWPLAVSSALMEQRKSSLIPAILALSFGHFLAMTAVLLPFSFMIVLVYWEQEIRIGAGLIVLGLGIYLLVVRRHPRILSRISPTKLALWSFLAAMAHGAGLMLVPIFLGICAPGAQDAGHSAAGKLMAGNLETALLVAIVHTAAMMLAGSALAVLTYFWLGLKFLSSAWFNLDVVWALSLVAVGVIAVVTAL